MTDKLWKRLYTDNSDTYEEMIQREDYQGNLLTALNDIHPLQNTKVVEFGAGTGRITRQLLPIVETICAFDLTPAMIKVAATMLKQGGYPNRCLGLGDSREMPVLTSWADVAVEGWSFVQIMSWHQNHWRSEVGRAIDEMIRVVRPEGTIILIETQGTGVSTPAPPEPHLKVHDFFEGEYGLSAMWIRTDFRFASRAEGQEIMGPIFGQAVLEAMIESSEGIILPECTGIWWGKV